MKKFLTILGTLIILAGLSYGVTFFSHAKFIDYSFVTGLVITILVGFFTSKGGFSSRNVDMTVQGTTGIKAAQQKFEFSPNLVFITSLAYTIMMLAVTLYYYRGML